MGSSIHWEVVSHWKCFLLTAVVKLAAFPSKPAVLGQFIKLSFQKENMNKRNQGLDRPLRTAESTFALSKTGSGWMLYKQLLKWCDLGVPEMALPSPNYLLPLLKASAKMNRCYFFQLKHKLSHYYSAAIILFCIMFIVVKYIQHESYYFNHFQVCSLVILSTLISLVILSTLIKYTNISVLVLLYSYHHHSSPEVFTSCKMETLYPLSTNSPFFSSPSSW